MKNKAPEITNYTTALNIPTRNNNKCYFIPGNRYIYHTTKQLMNGVIIDNVNIPV